MKFLLEPLQTSVLPQLPLLYLALEKKSALVLQQVKVPLTKKDGPSYNMYVACSSWAEALQKQGDPD